MTDPTEWQATLARVEHPAAPAPEPRHRRLARRIDPYVGPGSRWVPPLSTALENRAMETIGSLLDPVAAAVETLRNDPRVRHAAMIVRELPGDVETAVHLDLLPRLRYRAALAAYVAILRARRTTQSARHAVAELEDVLQLAEFRALRTIAGIRERRVGPR